MSPLEPRPEWGTWEAVELTDSQLHGVVGSSAFGVAPDPTGGGRWRITAKGWVGVADFDGTQLRVMPHLPVRRLVELLTWSEHRIRWDEEVTPELGEVDDVLVLTTRAWCRAVERIAAQGWLQGYRQVEDSLPVVRGRILVGAQMSRRSGLPLPVELAYDDFTLDIGENQLIAGAAAVLGTQRSLTEELRRRVRRIDRALVGVEAVRATRRPADIVFTRLNDRYRTAVALSRLVLRGAALDSGWDRRQVAGTGFLVRMFDVFEDFVGSELSRRARGSGSELRLQRKFELDDRGHLKPVPDLTWMRGDQVVAVGDIKYRDPAERDISGNVYQALAYARAFGLADVHLVFADQPEHPSLRVGDVTVHLHWLDLTLDRSALEARISDLSDLVLIGAER